MGARAYYFTVKRAIFFFAVKAYTIVGTGLRAFGGRRCSSSLPKCIHGRWTILRCKCAGLAIRFQIDRYIP